MKAYFSVFKLRLIYGLQYRAAALAGVATQFFWGIMHIMIYEAFYANAARLRQFPEQLCIIWLQHVFFLLPVDQDIKS